MAHQKPGATCRRPLRVTRVKRHQVARAEWQLTQRPPQSQACTVGSAPDSQLGRKARPAGKPSDHMAQLVEQLAVIPGEAQRLHLEKVCVPQADIRRRQRSCQAMRHKDTSTLRVDAERL